MDFESSRNDGFSFGDQEDGRQGTTAIGPDGFDAVEISDISAENDTSSNDSVISVEEEVCTASKMGNGALDVKTFQQRVTVNGPGYGSISTVQPQDVGGDGQTADGIAGVQQMQFSRTQALTTLGASKDKTQVGSAISLSLILIGILKTVLSVGPNGMKFYTPMLYLVSVTLSLQLLAGLISIYITMKRNFFSQYQGNLWRYCGKFCCPCLFSPKLPDTSSSLFTVDYSDENTPIITIGTSKCNRVVIADDENIGCCYCRFCRNSGTYEPFEIEILNQFDKWKSEETRALLEVQKADIEIENSKSVMNNLKTNLKDLQDKTSTNVETTREGSNCNEESINKSIQKEKDKITTLEKRKSVFQEYLELGKMLQKNVDKLRCKHLYMQASCLQNMLCVLVYVIVALNTFIIALGVIPNHGSVYGGGVSSNSTY